MADSPPPTDPSSERMQSRTLLRITQRRKSLSKLHKRSSSAIDEEELEEKEAKDLPGPLMSLKAAVQMFDTSRVRAISEPINGAASHSVHDWTTADHLENLIQLLSNLHASLMSGTVTLPDFSSSFLDCLLALSSLRDDLRSSDVRSVRRNLSSLRREMSEDEESRDEVPVLDWIEKEFTIREKTADLREAQQAASDVFKNTQLVLRFVNRVRGLSEMKRSDKDRDKEKEGRSREGSPQPPSPSASSPTSSISPAVSATPSPLTPNVPRLLRIRDKLPKSDFHLSAPLSPAVPKDDSARERRSSEDDSERERESIGSVSARAAATTPFEMCRLQCLSPSYMKYLSKCESWTDFDVFEFESLAGSRALVSLTIHLFDRLNFFNTFPLDRDVFFNFMCEIEDGYLPASIVPYHNHLHAVDVVQSVYSFLCSSPSFLSRVSPVDVLCLLLSSAVHDFRHPGTNNGFQSAAFSELAVVYNDRSVLENMHVSETFKLMRRNDCNILNRLPSELRKELRATLIALVLATDMQQHFSMLSELRSSIEKKSISGTQFDVSSREDRLRCAEIALHAADVGNPAKPNAVYLKMTERVLEEFWRQGDREKALSMPVSAMCDRAKPNVEKSQIGFIDVIVRPLYDCFAFLCPEGAAAGIKCLEENKKHWTTKLDAEADAADAAAAAAGGSNGGPGSKTTTPRRNTKRRTLALAAIAPQLAVSSSPRHPRRTLVAGLPPLPPLPPPLHGFKRSDSESRATDKLSNENNDPGGSRLGVRRKSEQQMELRIPLTIPTQPPHSDRSGQSSASAAITIPRKAVAPLLLSGVAKLQPMVPRVYSMDSSLPSPNPLSPK